MLDIEIYLDILEFIHATAGGEGVEVLFRILSGHSKGSELSVNAQIPHPLIAACGAISKRGRLLYAQSTISFCDRKKNRSFFAVLARLIGGMAAEILFSVGI